jgi:phosphatidylinositol 3-kinase
LEGDRDEKDIKALIEDPMLQFSGRHQVQQERSDLYVECQIFNDGKPVCLPCQTSHKTFVNRWSWNEWLQLPILVKDIPRTANLALTVYDILGPGKAEPVGGSTVSLFGKRSCLHKGNHDLKLWRNVVADGSADTRTPGKLSNDDSEMARLRKLVKKYRSGLLSDVDWMDRRVFREIEHVNENEKKESNCMYLMIGFPHFHAKDIEYRIVYYQKVCLCCEIACMCSLMQLNVYNAPPPHDHCTFLLCRMLSRLCLW